MEDIVHQFRTPATAGQIVQAILTGEGLAGWWGKRVKVEDPNVTLTFTREGKEVTMEFEVQSRVNPIVWKCTANGNPAWVGTSLSWEITESDGDRVVDFSHRGFAIGGPPYESTVAIWQHFIDSLRSYLETGRGAPWP